MRVLFDFIHPAHINFYKHLVRELHDEGHEVVLVCLARGKIPHIMREEFPNLPCHVVGSYAKSKWGLYLRTGLFRALCLMVFVARHRPDASMTCAAFQTDFMARLFGFPSLGVYDDPSHVNFRLSRRLLYRFLLPECLGYSGRNVIPFKGLKEWAYLSPRRFVPRQEALRAYGLEPKQYIFIRDVDTASLNYRSQTINNVLRLYELGLSAEKVLLSLEDKARRTSYANWQILEEPVDDIHSLMFYSRMVISSGDSMAREGAQLGVSGVYCGNRAMEANDALENLGFLHHVTDPQTLLDAVRSGEWEVSEDEQVARRQQLLETWDDPCDMVRQNLYELVGQASPKPEGRR